MFIIERTGEGSVSMDNEEAIENIVEQLRRCLWLPALQRLEGIPLHNNGVDLRKIEQSIIRQALEGLPATIRPVQKTGLVVPDPNLYR